MKISVLKLAKDDLKEIHMYLSGFSEKTPDKFRESFKKFCTHVADTPYMYSQYKYNNLYRKAVIAYDYLIFYQVDEENDTVKIYRVLHGKRNAENFI